MSKSDAHSACAPLCTRGSPGPHRREWLELKGPARARPSDPVTWPLWSRRWVSSPVQVEGSDLRIVPLIVGEIKKVRGCLLLSRLPGEKGTKQKGLALRKPSGGRTRAALRSNRALGPGLPTLTPTHPAPWSASRTQDCQKLLVTPQPCPPPPTLQLWCHESSAALPISTRCLCCALHPLSPALAPGAFLAASEKASPLRSLAPWH